MVNSVNSIGNKFLALFLLFATGFLIYLLSPILTPFLLGILLAYLFNPITFRLTTHGIPRAYASLIVLLLILLIIVLMILLITPVIHKQVGTLLGIIPSAVTWLKANLYPWVETYLGVQMNGTLNDMFNVPTENLVKAGSGVFSTVVKSGKAVFETLLNIIFIPVITFYLLRDWDSMIKSLRDLIPRRYEPTVTRLARECDTVLAAFVRGQLLVMLALSIFYAIALTLIGLRAGILIGIIIGIVSLVPYLGSIIGIVIAVIAALVQFGTFNSVMWVVFIFLLGHLIENLYLTPKLIGGRVGLHPVVVIFAILAGGVLFGLVGVLLALPIASICLVLLRNWKHYYTKTSLYRTKHG